MGVQGARNILVRVTESVHLTVSLPTTGQTVPLTCFNAFWNLLDEW
jgi:hypothetical protein